MRQEEIKHFLEMHGQSHLLNHWDRLNEEERRELLTQAREVDWDRLRELRQLLHASPSGPSLAVDAFSHCAIQGNRSDQALGWKEICEGRAGCLVVAGGQGTRLGFDGPKGLYPVTLAKRKSLFQLLAEKVAAASHHAGRPLPLALMTSPQNHEATLAYFEKHHFFGLSEDQLSFFTQKTLPLLDDDGNLLLETPSRMAVGPTGNGVAFEEMIASGVASRWSQQGIKHVTFILIDNPLADPFDAELIGFHCRSDNEASVKCVERKEASEKVGCLALRKGKLEVVEYSELPFDELSARDDRGSLKHRYANISLFCFSLDLVQKTGEKASSALPWHLARKKVKNCLSPEGTAWAWKFEKFIFDLLPLAGRVSALCYPREECFAPLKNAEGEDSPQTVLQALSAYDRKTYRRLFGCPPPEEPFELAPDYYYCRSWTSAPPKPKGGYVKWL